MKQRRFVAAATLAVCACADPSSAGKQAGNDGSSDVGTGSSATETETSGAGLSCEGAQPLALGRCVIAGTQDDCTGAIDEEIEYVRLAEGDIMRPVVGPQGSVMVVVMAATTGIDPGDPEQPASTENPLMQVELDKNDALVSRYRGRTAFIDDPDLDQLRTSSGLFVVIENLHEAEGPASIDARLRDADGQRRCGQIGVVIESESSSETRGHDHVEPVDFHVLEHP